MTVRASQACLPGTFNPGQGAASLKHCIACPAGKYSAAHGSTQCSVCAAGTVSELSGASSCESCPAGGFCPTPGAGSIRQVFRPCAVRATMPLNALLVQRERKRFVCCHLPLHSVLSLCSYVQAGTFNNVSGASSNASCQSCPPGKSGYSTGVASEEDACVACPSAKYNPLAGQAFAEACLPCPSFSTTLDGASTSIASCVCAATYYDANASVAVDLELLRATAARGDPVSMVAAAIECRACPVGTR